MLLIKPRTRIYHEDTDIYSPINADEPLVDKCDRSQAATHLFHCVLFRLQPSSLFSFHHLIEESEDELASATVSVTPSGRMCERFNR